MPEKPILQLALDILNLDRAIEIAKEAQASVDWIEAGTPLIKSEGMGAIRELKRSFPSHTIVADMKTMDTGAFETEMAAKAGADVVCILGAADDETIAEACRSARKYGSKIMVDLINATNPAKRAAEVEKLGADYVGIHVGIDQQMRGKTGIDIIKSVANAVKIPVSVAGGMNSELAALAVKSGASIVVVGGAITKAPNCGKAAEAIRSAMLSKKAASTELYKKYSGENIREAFEKVSTCNISDAMHRKGAMSGIRPVAPGLKFAGRALTVRTADGDWAKPVEAIDNAKKGDVLVIDACAGKTAIWGELATWSAKMQGIAGVVIDGAARDADRIREMKFPVFSKYIASNAGDPKGFGEIGAEIICGNQTVRSGDWIIGDDSGVVVVPQEQAEEIANRALDVLEQENRIREEIKRGSTLSKVLKLKKWEKFVG